MKNWLTPVHLLLIVFLGALAYGNTFGGPFVLDDLESIVGNESIRSLTNFLPGGSGLDFHFRRAVAYFTFAMNYRFDGLDVAGYHLFNLLVHLGSALLVYILVRLFMLTPRLRSSRIAPQAGTVALLAALVFVTHPLQTQAVTYIVQRLTSLCTFFYLLALVLYLAARCGIEAARAKNNGRVSRAAVGWRPFLLLSGSVAATTLAMFTKEIAFTLPLTVLLIDFTFFPSPWRQRLLLLTPLLLTLPIIPLLVAAGGEVSTAGTLVHSRLDIPRLHYLLTQLPVLATYLRLLILPIGQNLDYDYPIYTTPFAAPVIFSLALLVALLALAGWLYWRTADRQKKSTEAEPCIDPAWRLIACGILWFFLTIAVESSIVPLPDVIFEHRLYLPVVGLAIAMATLLLLVSREGGARIGSRWPLIVAGIVIIFFGVATWQRNQIWQSEVTLWEDTVRKSPGKVRPLYNYGYYLTEAGRFEEAVAVLTKVVTMDPQHADAWHNLGRAYLLLGRDRDALPALRTAVRLAPSMDKAILNLSSALLRTGQPAEALPLIAEVRVRSPDWPEVRFNLGLAHLGVGNLAAARGDLADLRRLNSPLAANLATIINRVSTRQPR